MMRYEIYVRQPDEIRHFELVALPIYFPYPAPIINQYPVWAAMCV